MSADKTRTALIAMDGSQQAEEAFNWYVKNLHRKGDEVVIVHVIHHEAHHYMGSVWAPIDAEAVSKLFAEETEKGRFLCMHLDVMLKKKELQGKVIQTTGDPGQRILATADECGADFIVTGSRGLGTIRRTILGSISDYLVHHAKIPIFIYRE